MASKSQLLAMRPRAQLLGARTARASYAAPARRFIASTTPALRFQNVFSAPAVRRQIIPASATGTQSVQRRSISEQSSGRGKLYSFEDVLDILENPSSSHLLIDVREPHEYDANTIPTAINIPIASQPDALLLSAEDFEDAFGFAKPPASKEIVMFCKAGVRSAAAAGIARQAGYENVGEYKGSWNEWVAKGGPGTKTPNEPGVGRGEATRPQTETKVTGRTGSAGEEDLGEEGIPKPPTGGLMGKKQ